MPWGCLCSKEKKRPQISSPILKSVPAGKHQLLPTVRRPLRPGTASAASEKLEQRLLDPNLNELEPPTGAKSSSSSAVAATAGDESSEEFLNGAGSSSGTSGSGGSQRDRLQQQLIQKSKLKSSNLKSTTYTRNTENDKLTRHLNNVKFAFDEPPVAVEAAADQPKPAELIRLDDEDDQNQVDCNGNGNYDVLPPQVAVPRLDVVLQIVEGGDVNSNYHLKVPPVQPDVVRSSTESIPYIDDEQSKILANLNSDPKKVQNFHDARIITLTPKNVGSQAEKQRGPSSPELKQLVLAKNQRLLEAVPQLAKLRFTHAFHILATGCCNRVCQQCHLVLSLDVALRCAICEFTCHQRCVRLEQKNNHEDEQQQIINKYNSLPIQQQEQQQQQSQQRLPQSRPTSSLGHVNNNNNNNGNTTTTNGNHYHNYSVHHQQQQQHQTPTFNQQQHHSYNNNNNISAGSNESALRLSYVTERILASILPARRIRNGGSPGFVDEHERELIEMLEQKHEKNYRIFDLESCIASISLEKLCELCKHIDSWLGSGKEKIVVLQDREDKQRLGAAIAAYLEYQKICGSNFPQSSRSKSSPGGGATDLSGRRTPTWLDLDIYSTQKFLESITGPLRIPSHKRYIRYFSGLLAGTIKMNASSVFLRAIIVESPPCLHYRAVTVNSEWRSFIKIFEGVRCLFTSDIYVIPITTRQFIYEIKHPLRLRGDVLIRCYQIIPNNNKLHDEKELISAVQFHTCAITQREVQFAKVELDLACDDERFPGDHKVTLCFNTTPTERSAIVVFQNPLVRIEPLIDGGDHLETINEDESYHTQGPLDGSLYATILKSPKSPTAATAAAAAFDRDGVAGGGIPQTLISPPVEFSNTRTIVNGTNSTSTTTTTVGAGRQPPVTPPPRNANYVYEGAKRYQSVVSSAGRVGYGYQGKVTSESLNGGVNPNENENNNNNSSGNYREVIENGSGYDQNQNPVGQRQQQSHQTHIRNQADGRESVRSPLTLSMDSGISSSGPVNRRLQGSSVSPSSFPSQTSPQDDRHRELDDLLSDMLMTVQGIPDVARKAAAADHAHNHQHHHHHHHQQQQQQQQRVTTHYQQQQNLSDHFVNTNTDTIKRSHSAQLPALREERADSEEGLQHSLTSSSVNKERELLMYETSSTTTTLTPPPSESGRDTPLLSSAYSTIRDKRDLGGSHCLTPTERELIMNLQHHQHQQHQSFGYPRQARSTTGASERFTSDDDDDYRQQQQIPYHAREDSRPFTYGSIPLTGTPQNPPASTMLKMQSGLSSPSMVRKALGTPTTGRKSMGGGPTTTTGRNSEFEEMLRERREKVFSEKYTIGDQQSSPGGGLGDNSGSGIGNRRDGFDTVDNGRWTTNSYTIKTVTTSSGAAADQQNGYHLPHEPLKRSNTMDGSFGRQFSNDGISGQTWLQLQQQKLRARKEQQKREHSNSFSYSYGSPAFPTADNTTLYNSQTTHRRSQTLSPVRNERSYHTLTTTRTHSNERPFVAVKRAHENAKMQSIGSAPLSVLNASPHGHIAQIQHQQAASPSSSMVSTPTGVDSYDHSQAQQQSQQQQQQQHQYTVNSSKSVTSSSSSNHAIINGHDQKPLLLNGSSNGSSSPVVVGQSQVQNGLLSLADHEHSTPKHGQARLAREESFSSYRSETEPDHSPTGGSPRPETPAFPVTPRTPYGLSNGTSSPALPPKSPTSQRKYNSTWSLRSQRSTVSTYDVSKDLFAGNQRSQDLINQNEMVSCYTSRRNSITSNANSEPQEVAPQFVKFARDSSKFWYKPAISREEAIGMLRNAPPGTFVVRDSTTFANAYGLVVKVAHPPPGVQSKGPNSDELVRHFLVEPTIRGVRLKGCSNEPVFTSLSALVYQHSITPLALPCRLIIPDVDLQQTDFQTPAQQQLLTQGAACNVLYLFTCDTESLTGPQAIRKAVGSLLSLRPLPKPTQVHFKVSIQGITLTDNTRQLFFRRHYPSNNVSFCGLDPDDHRWSIPSTTGDIPASKRIFAFVGKRSPTSADNQCHVFCELEATQPATAIVSFANKVVLGGSAQLQQQQQAGITRAI
ncbi:tensin-1 isoform X7 [Topomyia yanbarensis]|uniref:tensin-1 isoform X7 n=1 Tax=Topomyia yanbarensis TaxID=2498891 RepID=UPI00273A9833|nr:tensin-1 isoform X7 [Topomyia yanbarensis]